MTERHTVWTLPDCFSKRGKGYLVQTAIGSQGHTSSEIIDLGQIAIRSHYTSTDRVAT